MNPGDILFAFVLLMACAEGGAIILLYFLREQDKARVMELSKLTLALHEEFRSRTGTEIVVDRGLLEDRPDVVGVGRTDGEDYSHMPSLKPWGVE